MEVKAAGVNRILHWMALCDCGTISAECTYDESMYVADGINATDLLSEEEKSEFLVPRVINRANSRGMRGKIQMAGYSYIMVQGIYKEQGGAIRKEESYFVFDKSHKGGLRDFLIKLAFTYDQDSITYADVGSDFALYETTPFFLNHGGRRSQPTGRRIATFSGFSIKRVLQKLNPTDKEDRLRCAALMRKDLDDLDFDEKRALMRLLEKYAYQFFSEEDVLTRIRGKGIAWTNYQAVEASVNTYQSEPGGYRPTEFLYRKVLYDRMPKYCLANADLLED